MALAGSLVRSSNLFRGNRSTHADLDSRWRCQGSERDGLIGNSGSGTQFCSSNCVPDPRIPKKMVNDRSGPDLFPTG